MGDTPTATRTPTADDAFQFEVIEGTPTPTATHTATLTPSATGAATETMTASLTPDELPQLDAVYTVFSGATYDYDGESILRIACGEFEHSSNSRSKRDSDSYTYYVGGHY